MRHGYDILHIVIKSTQLLHTINPFCHLIKDNFLSFLFNTSNHTPAHEDAYIFDEANINITNLRYIFDRRIYSYMTTIALIPNHFIINHSQQSQSQEQNKPINKNSHQYNYNQSTQTQQLQESQKQKVATSTHHKIHWLVLLHHFMGILISINIIFFAHFPKELNACMFGSSVPNILLHSVSILKRDGKISKENAYKIFVLHGYIRVSLTFIAGVLLAKKISQSKKISKLAKLYCLSMLIFFQIVALAFLQAAIRSLTKEKMKLEINCKEKQT